MSDDKINEEFVAVHGNELDHERTHPIESMTVISHHSLDDRKNKNIDPDGEKEYKFQDEVTEIIGDGKRWQILITTLLTFCAIFPKFTNSLAGSLIFFPPGLSHYCKPLPGSENWTLEEWISVSHVNDSKSCLIYDLDYHSVTLNYTPNAGTQKMECHEWGFHKSHRYSVTEKWSLVCSRVHLVAACQYLFYFGQVLGNIIFGVCGDRRGRSKLLLLCIISQAILGIVIVSTSFYIVFVSGRFLLGFFIGGSFVLGVVYVVEMLGPHSATMFTVLQFLSLGLSRIALIFIDLTLPHWFIVQLIITIPLAIILSWKEVMVESPRWLLVMLHSDEALKVMRIIAYQNNIKVAEGSELKSAYRNSLVGEEDDDTHCNIFDVRNYPHLRTTVLILVFVLYGISVIQHIRINRFKIVHSTFAVQAASMGVTELASVMCTLFLILRYGYCKVICSSLVMHGLLNLLLLIFVQSLEKEDYVMAVILSITVYFLITIAFVSVLTYSSRILPTIIRGSGFGIICAFGNIGAMLVVFSRTQNTPDVKIFIVSLSLISIMLGLLGYVLPETAERELPDTLRDGEHFLRRPRPRRWLIKGRQPDPNNEIEMSTVDLW